MSQGCLDLPEGEFDEAASLREVEAAMRDAADLGKWPLRLVEIADVFEAALLRVGKPRSARELAELMAVELAHNQGGRPVYLPRGESIFEVLRARRIFDRVGTPDGLGGRHTLESLAMLENMSLPQVYRNYALIRGLERNRREPKLL